MPNALSVSLAASAARASSGDGAAVDVGAYRAAARVRVSVTDGSGANRLLSLTLSTSDDGATGWRTVAALGAANNSTILKTSTAGLGRFIRASWAISGTTPSFTFEVTAVAHTIYAEPGDLRLGVPNEATEEIPPQDIVEACIVTSDEADGYLGGGYVLPITAWSDDLRLHAAKATAYHLLNGRGRQPEGPDDTVDDGYKSAIRWLEGVAARRIRPAGIVDSTPEVFEAGSVGIVSTAPRGW
jgi:phage gp36-like protein